ncbi:winged helix-turn-helix domain-containing protein [Enterococcus avium]
MAKAILVSIKENEEEKLFKDLVKILDKSGIVLQEYGDDKEELKIADLQMMPSNICIKQNGVALDLTYREFYLLYHLARFPGVVFSKEHLYEILWQEYSFPKSTSSTVSALVSKVRKKLGHNGNDSNYILTIRGVGYRFNPGLK